MMLMKKWLIFMKNYKEYNHRVPQSEKRSFTVLNIVTQC